MNNIRATTPPVGDGDDDNDNDDDEQQELMIETTSIISSSYSLHKKQQQQSEDPINSFTIDDYLQYIGIGLYHYCLLLLCGVGYMAGTMELILITFLLPELKKEWGNNVSDYGASALAISVFTGSLIGSLFWGWLCDRIGRKIAFITTVLIATIFSILSALSPSLWWIIVFRFGVGFALGGNMSIDFILFLENIPIESRGVYLSFITFFGVVGVLLTVAIAWATIPSSTYGWRWFLIFCSLPSASLLIVRIFASHESPRFLLSIGKTFEAQHVLESIAKTNNIQLPSNVVLIDTAATNNIQQSQSSLYEKLFANFKLLISPSLRYISILLWLFWFLLTFAYYGITIWLPTYLHDKHLGSSNDLYFTFLLMGLSELPGLLLATILVGRIGRRRSLALFMFGCTVFTLLFSFATTKIFVHIFTCGIYFHVVGAWSIIYIYTAEVYPTNLRTSASGMKSIFATIGGIISPLIGAFVFSTLNAPVWIVLCIYGSAFFLGAIISIMFNIETLNRPLNDRFIYSADVEDVTTINCK